MLKLHLRTVSKHNWKTFDDLIESMVLIVEIRVATDSNPENWQNRKIICSCCYYLKNNVCIHCLSLAAMLKLVSFPNEAKSLPIGNKPKRGRPALAKKALVTQ